MKENIPIKHCQTYNTCSNCFKVETSKLIYLVSYMFELLCCTRVHLFSLMKVRSMLFRPETIVASFVHLTVFQ